MKRLLIFLPLLCLISCTEYADIETIVQIQEKDVSSELIEQTRQQLIQRLQRNAFQNAQVQPGKLPIQFVISTKIDAESEKRLQQYHRVFEKGGELGIWRTYRFTDPKIIRTMAGVPKISGLDINNGQYQYAVFASSIHEDSLSIVKQQIEKHFADFSNLRFLWSAKPDSYSGAYQLYGIDTKGRSMASITNEHIVDVRADYDGIREIYTVSMTMNKEGTQRWANMTRQALKREIAMVIDDRVVSSPTVQSEITSGRTEITGGFTADEAIRIRDLVKTIPLPYTLKIIDEKITTPE